MAFFIEVKITRSDENDSRYLVSSASAICVSNAKSESGAIYQARFHIEKHHWIFDEIVEGPMFVNEENFTERDLGLELYKEAIKFGFAFHIIGVASDGKEHTPRRIQLAQNPPISQLLEIQNRARAQGECLHPDSGDKCTSIIQAHSIPKSADLGAICDETNHVLMRYTDAARIRKANGTIPFRKIGIKEASVFRGFCSYHDNKLFEPIDNSQFYPDPVKVALIAYRSICKEVSAKKFMISVAGQYAELHKSNAAIHNLFKTHGIGGEIGLAMLAEHKIDFDRMLKTENYQDIRCTMFLMKGKPFFACSSLIFPDYGFSGELIQNRKDFTNCHGLLTCNTAVMEDAWVLLFTWHASCDFVCIPFMNSLKTVFREKKFSISNYIVHFLFSSFENLVISPMWFNSLTHSQQEHLNNIMNENSVPFELICSSRFANPTCDFIELDIIQIVDFPIGVA